MTGLLGGESKPVAARTYHRRVMTGPPPYFDLIRQMSNRFDYRLRLVQTARQQGIKAAARAFQTTVPTVRKWLRRYQQHGLSGLRERSRAPHQPVLRIRPAQRRRALELKCQLPSWGAARLQRDFQLPLSEKALRRLWRQEGLLRRKRRKHRVKRDLRAVQAAWRLFEQVDLDTKDQPAREPGSRLGLASVGTRQTDPLPNFEFPNWIGSVRPGRKSFRGRGSNTARRK